jgi:hypothetical protein
MIPGSGSQGLGVLDPGHESILVEPVVQDPLSIAEGQPLGRARAPQLDTQGLGEQATQGPPQGEARRVSPQMLADSGPQARSADSVFSGEATRGIPT